MSSLQKQYEIVKVQTEQDDELRKTSLTGLDADLDRMQKTLGNGLSAFGSPECKSSRRWSVGIFGCRNRTEHIAQGERIGQINVLTDYKIEANYR